MIEAVLAAVVVVQLVLIGAGVVYFLRYHAAAELDARAERAQLLNVAAAERVQLMDRVQAGDAQQYHALQAAYYHEPEPLPDRYLHDEFGFVNEPDFGGREDPAAPREGEST